MTDLSTESLSVSSPRPISPRDRRLRAARAPRSKTYYLMLLNGLLRLADIGIVVLAGACTLLLSSNQHPASAVAPIEIILIILLMQSFFQQAGLYRLPDIYRPHSFMLTLLPVWLVVGASVAALHYSLNAFDNLTFRGYFAFFVTAFLGFSGVRILTRWGIEKLYVAGRMAVPVAIIGTRGAIKRLEASLAKRLGTTVDLVAAFDSDQIHPSPAAELLYLCRTRRIAEILVAVDGQEGEALDMLLQQLGSLAITVRLAPQLNTPRSDYASLEEIYGAPTIAVIHPPLTDTQVAVKRCFDLIVSSLAICMVAPLSLFIAILIKIDSPGPVLFRQERWGFNSRPMMVLKFRTMFFDTSPDPNVPQARPTDSRISRVGRFLRRSSLDELPQLLNVLLGEMSLVGPRPHASVHNEYYASCVENYLRRHRLKPGITGLAQVNGCRGETETIEKMQKRVDYDLYYIENWSLLLDLKILLKTLLVGFYHPNAY